MHKARVIKTCLVSSWVFELKCDSKAFTTSVNNHWLVFLQWKAIYTTYLQLKWHKNTTS